MLLRLTDVLGHYPKDTLLLMPCLQGTFYMVCDSTLKTFKLGTETLEQLFLVVP